MVPQDHGDEGGELLTGQHLNTLRANVCTGVQSSFMPLSRNSIKQLISAKLLIVHESYRRLVQVNGGWKNGAKWADIKGPEISISDCAEQTIMSVDTTMIETERLQTQKATLHSMILVSCDGSFPNG